MIKKLQALRAKKGFTLVELIVVIAIIGVLAAILVPTMMGMVTKSRVTSLDQTAAKIKDTITQWMVDLDTAGGKVPSNAVLYISGKNTANGSAASKLEDTGWTITANELTVANDGAATIGSTKTDIFIANGDSDNKGALLILGKKICSDYDFTKDITAAVYVQDRKAVACVYTDSKYAESDAAKELAAAFPLKGIRGGKCGWNGKDAGVMDSGTIVGTSPKVELDDTMSKDKFEGKKSE